jgi:signal peptidase
MIRKKQMFIPIIIVMLFLVAIFSGCAESDRLYYMESSSMSHGERQNGIIDRGDFIICEDISNKNEIITWAFGKTIEYRKYGDYGDVIIYKIETETYICHRIMCWVEYDEEYGTYSIEDYGMINVSSITIIELGLENYMPNNSGFITKGDNNSDCDQAYGTCNEPVKLEWVVGNVVKLIDMKRIIIPYQEIHRCS